MTTYYAVPLLSVGLLLALPQSLKILRIPPLNPMNPISTG